MSCRFGQKRYVAKYFAGICCAELLRNCCVNLGVDPDMDNGFLLNFRVLRIEDNVEQSWEYRPSQTIGSVCTAEGTLELILRAQQCYR